ncbi:MAG: TadG family pilus assembly protein [Rubripirellula sp.]
MCCDHMSFDASSGNQVRRGPRNRRGAAAVLGLFLVISLVALTAVTLDFGYVHVAETELSRSADAAAMAGCWEVFDQQAAQQSGSVVEEAAKNASNAMALRNVVGDTSLLLNGEDVEVGTYGLDGSWSSSDAENFNAVRVTLRRQGTTNSKLPLFFGALTGRDTQSLHTKATAAMFNAIDGFYEPEGDENRGILPIALDEPSWLAALAGETEDLFSASGGGVGSGSDGLFETNLYPKGTGSPGNRGTVDIGGANNSTSDLSRQVLHGISAQDFIDLGKPLVFDDNGELELNGDTGISAGIKDELASLIGKTRIIPIFARVAGNGNNATFTIVRFEGIRILDVKLTGKGSQKRVIIQPAKVVGRGTKIDWTGKKTSSHLVTPVMLVE